ncbi:HAD family hydrolase [Paraburkholderia megapolitana]|uniref:HAD family hydrolase n=1 Tax=Paraburkholderia megapolitana TaxID=420953 RepID=UPI0038BBB865
MNRFKKIKLIAVDTNGVLLKDTFGVTIKRFIEGHGGVYTAELERLVLGAPHIAGGHIMSLACRLPWTAQETIDAFLAEHKIYTRDDPVVVNPGVDDALALLHGTGARITTYGGRPEDSMFSEFLHPFRQYFDRDIPYVNIDQIRPGMKEIVKRFGCRSDEVLFIDDLGKVGDVCKTLGCGFIGAPVTAFQRQLMQEAGVTHLVDSIAEISVELLDRIDDALSHAHA